MPNIKVPLIVMGASTLYREFLTRDLIKDLLRGYPEDVYPMTKGNMPGALKTIHYMSIGRFQIKYPHTTALHKDWGRYIYHFNGSVSKLVSLVEPYFNRKDGEAYEEK